jgi:hypothetical protein
MTGPYESRDGARRAPEVAAAYDRFAGDQSGGLATAGLAMLLGACEDAGVTLGAFDQRILTWLAGFDIEASAAVAGIIRRAAEGGK